MPANKQYRGDQPGVPSKTPPVRKPASIPTTGPMPNGFKKGKQGRG